MRSLVRFFALSILVAVFSGCSSCPCKKTAAEAPAYPSTAPATAYVAPAAPVTSAPAPAAPAQPAKPVERKIPAAVMK